MPEITDGGTIDYTQIEINFQERTAMRAQQTMSPTEPFITYVGGKGRETKTTFWGGQNSMGQKSQRHDTYPQYQTEREAYWFGSTHFWAKEPIDGDDQLFDATDASSGLSQVWGAAAAREKDRLYINAAIGLAYRGRYGQNTAQALPSSQIIPHGNSGLTEAKIREAVGMIRRTHPEQSDPIVTMLTSSQFYGDLMGQEKVINADYNAMRPLANLNLPFFLGTYFKLIDDYANFHPNTPGRVVEFDPILPLFEDAISSGVHVRYVVMWIKSAMRGKKDRPIQTRLHDESKDHGPDAKSLTVDFMEGGTRVDPLGVVVIECAESADTFVA